MPIAILDAQNPLNCIEVHKSKELCLTPSQAIGPFMQNIRPRLKGILGAKSSRIPLKERPIDNAIIDNQWTLQMMLNIESLERCL